MYIQKKAHKKIMLFFILSIFLCSVMYSQVFFDTEAGIALDALPNRSFDGAELHVRGFHGSQIQLGSKALIESEFSFKTQDLLLNQFFNEIPADFTIDKLSFSYQINGLHFNTRLSVFAGTQDIIGSDNFAKKYFGTKSFSSTIFDKEIAIPESGIFGINGFGIEANTVFSPSFGTSFYAYHNEKDSEDTLNLDLRLVGVANAAIVDFTFGTSMPFDTKDEKGNDAFLVVKTVNLHTALSLLIGNNPYANLYLQAGATKIQTDPEEGTDALSLDDLHLLIEPRFTIGNMYSSLSFFFMPQSTVSLIEHIQYPVGASLYMDFGQNLGKTSINYGGSATVSYKEAEALNFDVEEFSVILVPFVSLTSGSGEMKISIPVNVLEYEHPENMFFASISYKTTI